MGGRDSPLRLDNSSRPTYPNKRTHSQFGFVVGKYFAHIYYDKILNVTKYLAFKYKRETGVNTKFCKVYYNSLIVAFIGKCHKQYDQMLKLKVGQFFFKSCPKCCQISLSLKRDVFKIVQKSLYIWATFEAKYFTQNFS